MRRTLMPALFAAFALAAMPAMAQDASSDDNITVQGLGEAYAAPDMATVTSGVVTRAETARAALDANNEAAGELMSLLEEMGIASRDMQTSNFSVQPIYEQREPRPVDGSAPASPEIIAYEVSNSLTVRIRDLDMLGQVLDEAVTVGANRINGVSFSVADTRDIDDEARRAAVANARHKAELYAEAAGVDLGDVQRIEEADYGRPMQESMQMARMAADSGAVPMASGELTFTSRVTISWEIDNDRDDDSVD